VTIITNASACSLLARVKISAIRYLRNICIPIGITRPQPPPEQSLSSRAEDSRQAFPITA